MPPLSGPPTLLKDIDKIESAQRRAARWATGDYKYASSVTEMLGIDTRLVMPYKITYEPRHEKTNVLVCDMVQHKPGCTATEDG